MRTFLTPFRILFITMLLDMIGFGLVIPLIPFYAEKFGGGGSQIGILMALFALGQLIAAPIWGRLSDHFGRRPMLIIAVLGEVLSYAALPFAPSLLWLFVLRFIAGITSGNITIVQAYLTDITAPIERSKKMGTLGVANGIGFLVGPLIGSTAGDFGLGLPLYIAAVMLALNALFIIIALPEPIRRSIDAQGGSQLSAAFHSEVFKLLTAGACTMVALSGMITIFAIFTAQKFGFGPREIGYSVAYNGILVIILRLAFGPLLRWFGEKNLMIIGSLCAATALFFVPLMPTVFLFITAYSFLAGGFSFFQATYAALISKNAPAHHRGVMMGIANTALGIGNVTGPLLCGLLFDIASPITAFIIGGCMALIGALVGSTYRSHRHILAPEPQNA